MLKVLQARLQHEPWASRCSSWKGVHRGCILSPCLFNLHAEYIMRNAGLEEAQAGIEIAGRNINNLRFADDTTLMAESEEELKSPLMNGCFWTMVLEKTLESPLDWKEVQAVHPKGDQSWVFIGRPDAEAETPILWPPDGKSWLISKDPDGGKDWGQEEKGATEDGWMASLTQWTWIWVDSGSWWWIGRPGVLRFMGSQKLDTTKWLNRTELNEKTNLLS